MDDQKLMILDLDETLIHSPLAKLDRLEDFHFEDYYTYIRPYLSDFLKQCSRIYTIAIWSSAGEDYVRAIVNRIVPSFVKLKFVWARPNYMTAEVLKWGNSKNLKRLIANGLNPLQVLIIDDNPDDSVIEFGNVLQIKPYRGEDDDCELLLLSKYLQKIQEINDIHKIAYPLWRNEVKE